jgi:hypothetical protein
VSSCCRRTPSTTRRPTRLLRKKPRSIPDAIREGGVRVASLKVNSSEASTRATPASAGRTAMRRSITRPGAKLISVKAAAEEYGLPAALLYDLIKRGELPAVQPPNIRRVYIVRADLEQKLGNWQVAAL